VDLEAVVSQPIDLPRLTDEEIAFAHACAKAAEALAWFNMGSQMTEELKPCPDIAERLDDYAEKLVPIKTAIIRGTSMLVADLILAAAEIRRLRADRDAVLEEAAQIAHGMKYEDTAAAIRALKEKPTK
jgi:hypothetical protein